MSPLKAYPVFFVTVHKAITANKRENIYIVSCIKKLVCKMNFI